MVPAGRSRGRPHRPPRPWPADRRRGRVGARSPSVTRTCAGPWRSSWAARVGASRATSGVASTCRCASRCGARSARSTPPWPVRCCCSRPLPSDPAARSGRRRGTATPEAARSGRATGVAGPGRRAGRLRHREPTRGRGCEGETAAARRAAPTPATAIRAARPARRRPPDAAQDGDASRRRPCRPARRQPSVRARVDDRGGPARPPAADGEAAPADARSDAAAAVGRADLPVKPDRPKPATLLSDRGPSAEQGPWDAVARFGVGAVSFHVAADVAQLVEQRFCKPPVPGSSPVVGSN